MFVIIEVSVLQDGIDPLRLRTTTLETDEDNGASITLNIINDSGDPVSSTIVELVCANRRRIEAADSVRLDLSTDESEIQRGKMLGRVPSQLEIDVVVFQDPKFK